MAANSAITVTNLNFDEIKSSIKTYISSKQEFSDYNFEGSTISMLIDMLAYNTYQNAYYTSMVGNEMFLDSAQLRDSVVSRAKMLGYTPRSARGASTTLTVTVTPDDSPDNVIIAKNTEWTTTIDGETYKFVTPEAYVLSAEDSYSGTITIKEGRPITHRWTVDTSNPTNYIIPNADVDTTSLTVTVQTSINDASSETYILASDITSVTATSAVYFLQETDDSEYEIYFGNDVIGKQPENGNIVIVSYRIVNGKNGNDISTFTNPSTLGGYSTFTLTVDSATSGGAGNESIDSIKFNAPKNYETQNRAVLASDYKRIILRDQGDIESVNVWGGEENTPPIYGKVYISVKPITGTVISQQRKNDIKTSLKSYNVLSIDPEFVDTSYLYVVPTIEAKYDPSATTLTAGEVQNKVIAAVVSFESNNLGSFDKAKFRYSKFMKDIDNSDASIQSNITTIKLEKRFTPSTTAASTYNIAFNNKIKQPVSVGHISHSGGHYISSSSFTYQNKKCYLDDDGDGNIRIYYFSGSTSITYLDETAGTVNYSTGLVTLNAFFPTAIAGSYISVYATPDENDVKAIRNQILLISGAAITIINDNTAQIAATTVTATTTGVTTTVIDSGLYPVVY